MHPQFMSYRCSLGKPGSQIRQFFACVLILFWDDQVNLKNCVANGQTVSSFTTPP